ncbi:MAG: hypothetical protein CM15mP130_2210 [Verrucomicrobiota bacterium]|nr:MAG: hypothetical protein CM15mP130_2210 [Verrucomicrobiota bacterium]
MLYGLALGRSDFKINPGSPGSTFLGGFPFPLGPDGQLELGAEPKKTSLHGIKRELYVAKWHHEGH